MLYDSANNPLLPCLYICPGPVTNVLGRAPLIPFFIGGNIRTDLLNLPPIITERRRG